MEFIKHSYLQRKCQAAVKDFSRNYTALLHKTATDLFDRSTDAFVTGINISVKDEHGELSDLKGLPLEFELKPMNAF